MKPGIKYSALALPEDDSSVQSFEDSPERLEKATLLDEGFDKLPPTRGWHRCLPKMSMGILPWLLVVILCIAHFSVERTHGKACAEDDLQKYSMCQSPPQQKQLLGKAERLRQDNSPATTRRNRISRRRF